MNVNEIMIRALFCRSNPQRVLTRPRCLKVAFTSAKRVLGIQKAKDPRARGSRANTCLCLKSQNTQVVTSSLLAGMAPGAVFTLDLFHGKENMNACRANQRIIDLSSLTIALLRDNLLISSVLSHDTLTAWYVTCETTDKLVS